MAAKIREYFFSTRWSAVNNTIPIMINAIINSVKAAAVVPYLPGTVTTSCTGALLKFPFIKAAIRYTVSVAPAIESNIEYGILGHFPNLKNRKSAGLMRTGRTGKG